MAKRTQVDVAVIGGGPAGMAAAAAAREAGAGSVVLVERDRVFGGVLNQCIHDGFGTKVFNQTMTGPEYAAIYADKVKETEVEPWLETLVLNLDRDRLLTVMSGRGMQQVEAGAIVLAMGCRERSRGAIGIPGTRPAGVYTAGAAQYYMNIRNIAVGRRVVILGSGDIGLIMARRLTLEGAEVVCVAEILPYASGLVRNLVQCLDDFNIPLYLSTTVSEIHGDKRVEGVTLTDVGPNMEFKPETSRRIDCDTLMLSVGLIPENELSVRAGVDMSPVTAGPVVDGSFQTSIPGVFAAGNVLQVHDIVDYATLEAENAGRNAALYAQTGKLPESKIEVKAGAGLRYVLPAKISGEEAVDFTMRVVEPAHDRSILFKSNGRLLRRLRQPSVEPALMVRVRLAKNRFADVKEITVEVGE
ncbi:MAG: FAD-dependent oxidoreductase [Dehalococcoidia bacterium]